MRADKFDEIREEIEQESQTNLRENQALSRLLLDMWKGARQDFDKSRVRGVLGLIAFVVACLAVAGCVTLGITVYKQAGEIEAIHRILDQGVLVEETTTETTTTETITQDAGEGGGNNVYQTGEYATYTQQKDGAE